MKLSVPMFFAGRNSELEEAVVSRLYELGIRTGPITYLKPKAHSSAEVMVIPITENPTALIAPPPVNITQARGCVVLRDLLGYQQVNGKYVFTSDEILKRAASITEDQIAARVASPVKVGREVRRVPSPVTVRAVARCLDEIKRFAQWAVSHNYRQLAAA